MREKAKVARLQLELRATRLTALGDRSRAPSHCLPRDYRSQFPTLDLSPPDRLAGMIEARQLTPAELSRASQVPGATINEILGGHRGISKANALRLAKFCGVPTEEIIAE